MVTRKQRSRDGMIRIIGGSWRSRRLRFPDVEQLRPSPDVVRETLFNWLRNDIQGARCLDLYAGSGALGFEAASRGADHVVMVESRPQVAQRLRENTAVLQASDQVVVVHGTAEQFIENSTDSFDLIFLDPPFASDQLALICGQIDNRIQAAGLLRDAGLIYIESPKSVRSLPVSADWQIIRQKQRGQIQSTLIQI